MTLGACLSPEQRAIAEILTTVDREIECCTAGYSNNGKLKNVL
jgi:restriction endonuclease S subunit